MSQLYKTIITVSFVMLTISFWNRNMLPEDISLLPELSVDPVQEQTLRKAFSVDFNDVNYLVEPKFQYDLYGLVVSYRHHDGNRMIHKFWNDHLNMVDVCVVWRDSASNPYLNRIEFSNGQFTCNIKTNDELAWSNFNIEQISNNHLLSADDSIRDTLEQLNIGDQIHIRGWLARYSNDSGFNRDTSVTRTDMGNGACETIYVSSIEILQPIKSVWRKTMYLSLIVFLVSLFLYLRSPFRAP